DSGTVAFFNGVTTSLVTYAGLEPIRDTTTASNRVFNADPSLSSNIVASSSAGLTNISSGNAKFESITFNNPTSTLTINGSNGDDTIQLSGGDALFAAGLTINGNDGSDTIDATGWTRGSTLNGGLGGDTINGGSAGDAINGGDDAD